MLRSVGSNSMFPVVLCLGQEWHVVWHRVRRVYPLLLRGTVCSAGLPVMYKTWVILVCLILGTPFGRGLVGALPS